MFVPAHVLLRVCVMHARSGRFFRAKPKVLWLTNTTLGYRGRFGFSLLLFAAVAVVADVNVLSHFSSFFSVHLSHSPVNSTLFFFSFGFVG